MDGTEQVDGAGARENNASRGRDLQRWSDAQQYRAEPQPTAAQGGPVVTLLNATPDPLGSLAALTAMYQGRVVRSLSEVTDDERRAALKAMGETALSGPLEVAQFHFIIEGVDRAFTHQLVRGRNAFYAQESLRFAVVEDMAALIPLPPSLAGKEDSAEARMYRQALIYAEDRYQALVGAGVPAEEARGLLPHAVLTRVHWVCDLRELLHVAGLRTCTQAQFVWRQVMAGVAQALRGWGEQLDAIENSRVASGYLDPRGDMYLTNETTEEMVRSHQSTIDLPGVPKPPLRVVVVRDPASEPQGWQFKHIADALRPVCYQTGRCGFMAAFDRSCSIRARVAENEGIGRPSSEWHLTHDPADFDPRTHMHHRGCKNFYVGGIDTWEWAADPGAARVREGK